MNNTISETYKSRLQELSGIINEEGRLDFLKKRFIDFHVKEYKTRPGFPQKQSDLDFFVKEWNKEFDIIINADPTANKQYSNWLLNLYMKRNLALEDDYKAKEYLELFDKIKQKLPQDKRDINKYNDLTDLFDVILPFKDKEIVSKSEEERTKKLEGADRVFEDSKWLIIHPKTEEAACLYGKETEWCTAAEKSKNIFQDYNRQGPLYILFDKSIDVSPRVNKLKKLQFNFESNGGRGDFMDSNDKPIDVTKFFKKHPELLNLFIKIGKANDKFLLVHRLIEKDKAIELLQNNETNIELIKKFGLKWIFDYYSEIGQQKELVDKKLNDPSILRYLLESGKINELVEDIKEYSDKYKNKVADILYKNTTIQDYLQRTESVNTIENYFNLLYKISPLGKSYAEELAFNSDYLYNMFKRLKKLMSFYNTISHTKAFGSIGARNGLERIMKSKYKKDFMEQNNNSNSKYLLMVNFLKSFSKKL